ncbi:DUF6735 family protein [Halalkalicoccus salilacus]|uniref:DUF6735 family protein n=1 Tax=Halalkalicoccus TaxID=332246 RepID=UPI002F9629EB
MAHRTLLARRRENGTYDVFRLRDRSDRSDPDGPVATALSFDAVFDHVAFETHESVVIEAGTWTTYLVVPFSIPTADYRRPIDGACIALRPEAGLSEAYVRGWVHAMKEVLGDAIDRGLLTEREAIVYLEDRVQAFAETTEVIVP